jgi:hypothetical protein
LHRTVRKPCELSTVKNFIFFQDKNGVVKIGNQEARFKVVANRPSKKDSIKVEQTDAEGEEAAVEIKEEIPQKTFKQIQVKFY